MNRKHRTFVVIVIVVVVVDIVISPLYCRTVG